MNGNNDLDAGVQNLVADRCVDVSLCLLIKVGSGVASLVARRVELWGDALILAHTRRPRRRAGLRDELLVRPDHKWRTPGRDLAAAFLLPLAEA